jgi:hypothetical protein
MHSAGASPTWRPFTAALIFGVLLTGLPWMRPSLGGVGFLVGFVLILGLLAVLPICILILVGDRPYARVARRTSPCGGEFFGGSIARFAVLV